MMNDDKCECSCHHDGSHHISACCYTCLRCETDKIRPINFGDKDLCKRCEAFAKLTDAELREIVKASQQADPRRHKVGSVLDALSLGMDAEIELHRRARERLSKERT